MSMRRGEPRKQGRGSKNYQVKKEIVMIIILGIIVGLILAFVIAPIIMAGNRSKIKTMQGIVGQYESTIRNRVNDPEANFEQIRRSTRKHLMDLKSKIFPSDKKSVEQARDILDDFDQIPIPGR